MFKAASPIGVKDVARLLSDRKSQGKRTSLFLGSRAGGLFGNQTFYDYIKGYSLRNFENLPEIEKFQEGYRILKEHFQEEEMREILTESLKRIDYREEDELLAGLVKVGLFDAIISTNIDSLLEDTFVLKGMRKPRDYVVLNGIDNNRGRLHLNADCCTVLKILGDLGSLNYRIPVDDFSLDTNRLLKKFLKGVLTRDILVLGYDPLWDKNLESAFFTREGFCYVGEVLPPQNSKIAQTLDKSNGKYLVGLSYKRFTRELYSTMIGKPLRQKVRKTAPLPMTASLTTAELLNKKRQKIFVSYSHKDAHYLERFKTHMAPYLRNEQDLLELWDDSKIQGGQKWDEKIKAALATTKVAVLLISANFFASDYIAEQELPPLLKAAEAEEITILPVILGHSSFRNSPLYAYLAMNDISLPLSEMEEHEQDSVWNKTAQRVYNIMIDANKE